MGADLLNSPSSSSSSSSSSTPSAEGVTVGNGIQNNDGELRHEQIQIENSESDCSIPLLRLPEDPNTNTMESGAADSPSSSSSSSYSYSSSFSLPHTEELALRETNNESEATDFVMEQDEDKSSKNDNLHEHDRHEVERTHDQVVEESESRRHSHNDAQADGNNNAEGVQELDEEDLAFLIKQGEMTKKLSLSNRSIRKLPKEVLELKDLVVLDLSANRLKKVTKNIGELRNLKRLSLNHNTISSLPHKLWGLSQLTALFLNNNKLKTLSPYIRHLTNLKTLDVSSNKISAIPLEIGQLSSLQELRARQNRLEYLPTTLVNLVNLKELAMDGNPLVFPPKTVAKQGISAIFAFLGEVSVNGVGKAMSLNGQKSQPVLDLTSSQTQVENSQPPAQPIPQVEVAHESLVQQQLVPMQELLTQPDLQGEADRHKKRKNDKSHGGKNKKKGMLLRLEEELRIATTRLNAFEAKNLDKDLTSPREPKNDTISTITTSITTNTQPQFSLPPKPAPTTVVGGSSDNHFEWEIQTSEIQLGRRLGRGSYGEVWRGKWNNTPCAVKKIYTDNITEKVLSDLRREVDLLCKLRHPNVVLFMGACTKLPDPCIVMEFVARGSLSKILMDEKVALDYSLKLEMLIDTARGVAYLHNCRPPIIHRDLKTENLLVDDNWQIKVADFGLAKSKTKTYAKTNCGTVGYAAPEVLQNKPYTEKADIYSFGVIMWEVYTREIPYSDINTIAVIRSIDKGETLPIPVGCPKDYLSLMITCWDLIPDNRPDLTNVLGNLETMLDALDGP